MGFSKTHCFKACLEMLEGIHKYRWKKKRTSSIETYLSIIANYIDIFVSYFDSLGKSVKIFKSPSFLDVMAMLGQRKQKY